MTKNHSDFIKPVASVAKRSEFQECLLSDSINEVTDLENKLISASAEPFNVDGFCIPCDKKVSFLVDMNFGGRQDAGVWIPNWRERLECPHCKMNNRQRLVSALIKQELTSSDSKHVYFMEQVTPIYNWALSTFKNHNIIGSEYLGYEYKSGDVINDIRHEDIEALSFQDGELDLIVSNDVFEHVPHPEKAFSECARVLKVGGAMIATIPFSVNDDESVSRARLVDGVLEHLLTPAYHGNPISDEGSLVFTDYGWDLLQMMKAAGFSDVIVDVYSSVKFGNLGGGQIVFRSENNTELADRKK